MGTVKSTQIVPTILANTTDEFNASVALISEFANRVQIDISDGTLASSNTVDLENIFWPNEWQVDLHMMTDMPSRYVDKIIAMRPSLVIFHAEVREDLRPIFEKLAKANIKTGLALQRATVPETKADLIKIVNHVLIFAGELGKMGGQANLLQTEKVQLIKAISPGVEIGWDGGANVDNLPTIFRAGVKVINVGSAISRADDPKMAYTSLVELVDKYGSAK